MDKRKSTDGSFTLSCIYQKSKVILAILMYYVKKAEGALYVMKLLSFKVKDQIKFGPKVKREEEITRNVWK